MVKKGKVSTILDGGKSVTATPYAGGTVTAPLTVPSHLVGFTPVGTPIIYVTFDDYTGLVLSRMDGEWGGMGGNIGVSTVGDAIVINTNNSTVSGDA